MYRLLICFTLSFILFVTPEAPALSYEDSKSVYSIQNDSKEKVVGNVPEADIMLFAVEREGYLEKFRLEVNGSIQSFPYWKSVSHKTFYPQLHYKDINKDGIKELMIVLTQDHGTGILEQNIHVLHKTKTNIGEVYREIIVDNPRAILLKNVKTTLTESEAIITIGTEKTVITVDKFGIDPEYLFTNVVTANLLRYDVIDDKLTAIIGAQISHVGGFIGSFFVTYDFRDGMYQAGEIEFVLNKF